MSNNFTTERLPEGFIYEDGLPLKVSLLRWKLGNKAKQEPNFKFYALYDRIYRWDVLQTAYDKVRKNNGSPGCDGISFEDIEASPGGVNEFLLSLQQKLKEKTYSPKPVKRVYISKPDGKLRPLGIPCIVDRVAQQAVLLIIEPIFEQDFQECSYGFRPGRSAHDALGEIKGNLHAGKVEIYDADLSSYFDTIDHELLMEAITKRIVDRSVLRLIRLWLKCQIIEKDKNGGSGQTKITKSKEGTPQGGVISPLLANIFLNNFDLAFYTETDSPYYFAKAKLIRYADDFVIMAKYITENIIWWIEKKIECVLKLSINRNKTTVVKLNKEGYQLDFLGYTFRKDKDLKGRPWKYLNMFPSKKSVNKFKESLKEELKYSGTPLPVVIGKINQKTRGWKEYFKLGYPRKAFRDINYFMLELLKDHLSTRSQRKCRIRRNGESYYAAFKKGGLVYL